jgi:hypothetical protein
VVDILEKNFEQTIETILTQGTVVPQGGGAGHAGEAAAWFAGQPGGYRKRTPEGIQVAGVIFYRSYLTSSPKTSSTTSNPPWNNSG